MSDWTDAKRPRQPLQSKLISDSYYNVTRPRSQTFAGTRNTVPDKCLMDFGFIRSTAIDRLKRKRSSALQSNTIMDSQADSDDEPFLPGSRDLEALQTTTLHRPNKRRRSTGIFVPDVSASSDPPSSPLPQAIRHGMTTPTTCRIRNDFNDFDIPSSLSYERYDHRHWNELDTPPRIAKFRIYTEPSPPPSSGRVEAVYATMSPTRQGAFDVLTPSVRSQGMLTPPHSRYGPRPEPESSPFEVVSSTVQKETRHDLRLPLSDMRPTLIPTPQARQRSTESRQDTSHRHSHRTGSVSTTTSLGSRPGTPSIWHDAVESFDEDTQDHNTVEDSQDQEMFDSLTPTSPRPDTQNSTTTRPVNAHSQHFSWIPTSDSLMETLLPPDYGSSQYDDLHSLELSSCLSQTCRAPPPFSLPTQSPPSAVTTRKRSGEEDDGQCSLHVEKRQKNF